MKLKNLQKGDIFQDGKNTWDGIYRFHSCEIIDGRLFIKLMSLNYRGEVATCKPNSFTWRNIEHEVYIPVLYKCEFKKSKGIPCIPVHNHRIFYPNNLNNINISDKYCNGNEYWYNYADLIY